MSGLVLKSEDRKAFLTALKATKKPALEHRLMNVLLLLEDRWESPRVAEALCLDVRTVEKYRRLDNATGASGIGTLGYKGHTSSQLTEPELVALKAHMAEQMYLTWQAICFYVEKTLNHIYTKNAMTKLLKRLLVFLQQTQAFSSQSGPGSAKEIPHRTLAAIDVAGL